MMEQLLSTFNVQRLTKDGRVILTTAVDLVLTLQLGIEK